MAGNGEYCQFFRFRAPVGRIEHGARRGDAEWLAPSTTFIDVSEEVLIEEFLILSRVFPGVSYRDLQDMSMYLYGVLLEKAKKIGTEKENGEHQ